MAPKCNVEVSPSSDTVEVRNISVLNTKIKAAQ